MFFVMNVFTLSINHTLNRQWLVMVVVVVPFVYSFRNRTCEKKIYTQALVFSSSIIKCVVFSSEILCFERKNDTQIILTADFFFLVCVAWHREIFWHAKNHSKKTTSFWVIENGKFSQLLNCAHHSVGCISQTKKKKWQQHSRHLMDAKKQ